MTQVPPAKLLAARAAASAALAAAQPRLPAESPSEALPAAAAHPPSPSKRKRPRDGDAEDDELAAASRPLKIARDAFNGPVANGTGGPDAAANGRPLPAAKRPGGAGLLQNGHGPCTASAAADAGGGQPAAKGAAAGGGASNAPAPAPAALAAAEASDAGLGEAVGWCRRRMAWDSLLLQLQVGAAVHNLPGPFTADCKGVKAPYSFAICELCIASRLHVCFSSHQLQTSSRVALVRRRSGRPSQSSSHTGHPAAPPRTLQQGRRRPRRHGRCARCACAASRRSQPWTRQRLSRTSARRRRPRLRPVAWRHRLSRRRGRPRRTLRASCWCRVSQASAAAAVAAAAKQRRAGPASTLCCAAPTSRGWLRQEPREAAAAGRAARKVASAAGSHRWRGASASPTPLQQVRAFLSVACAAR